jgi:hypothetical protein
MEKDDAKFTIEGNPGSGNTFINVGTAYNVNPNAKEVNNTFIMGNGKEAAAAIKEAMGTKPESLYDRMKEPEENIDCTPIRTEILNYVSRVRPLLKEEAKSSYMKMWEDILDLPEVAALVYKPGKQWGTNFNRDLVANILYHLRARKIYNSVYKDNYNGAAMTEALEQDKEHSVKHALRDEPPKEIRDAIDAMLAKKY